jgi:hypothetical protein
MMYLKNCSFSIKQQLLTCSSKLNYLIKIIILSLRKEIYYEKLTLMSKEANGEEYYKMSEKIDELDTEIQRLS